ncbi:hypothetical protein K491DRAFT_688770 [Lophiostoma macrostomum CBS 122681]|uniref:TPR domain-containing protein n=1 Tax=Lophiostoma macrostomum CBS 122681 TaxID=1314788 RepID=A0A6A6TKT5_9PLEO|nr:hypothetical protein K491DRAFT_688770 [Lophiostoma macrostomum CBS 122681]
MFARAVPRAASRIGSHVPCEPVHAFTKLPSRTWRPLQQQIERRHKTTFVQQAKEQYRQSPFMFTLAISIIVGVSTFAVTYLPWYYRNVIVKPYHRFPEPVAKKLRRALFYSRQGSNYDIREANKYFRQALAVATEEGMDPFSDEILGVKYLISHLFEQAGQYPLACDVLEIMRVDCQRWMDEFSHRHWEDGSRSRVLKSMVQLNVKLGELYSSEYMNEPEDAEKRYTEAVETILKERNRREKEGVKQGEGDWMTDEELGGTMESLGHHYEKFDSHYLATPLFVQALALCPPKSCHGVILMNNISTCLAQQTPPPSSSISSSADSFSNAPPPPRAVLVDHARQWAEKALARAATITPPDRDEECDAGCAAAMHNLGEFLEMEGKLTQARQKYEEAAALSKKVGFADGQANAKESIKRVKKLEKELAA